MKKKYTITLNYGHIFDKKKFWKKTRVWVMLPPVGPAKKSLDHGIKTQPP